MKKINKERIINEKYINKEQKIKIIKKQEKALFDYIITVQTF